MCPCDETTDGQDSGALKIVNGYWRSGVRDRGSDGPPFCGLDMAVLGRPSNEGQDGCQHCNCRYGKTNCPGYTVLDVHHDGDSQQGPDIDRKVKPIEEAFLLQSVLHAQKRVPKTLELQGCDWSSTRSHTSDCTDKLSDRRHNTGPRTEVVV